MENPFRPTAGATPPDLVGRGGVLDEFAHGSPSAPPSAGGAAAAAEAIEARLLEARTPNQPR